MGTKYMAQCANYPYQGYWTSSIQEQHIIPFVFKLIGVFLLSEVVDAHKVAMFLKVQFLEGKARKELFTKYPPKIVYISSSRLLCAKNAEFDHMKAGGGSAVAYAWYVWEKGFTGQPQLAWFN